jgi:hypothetical protein
MVQYDDSEFVVLSSHFLQPLQGWNEFSKADIMIDGLGVLMGSYL